MTVANNNYIYIKNHVKIQAEVTDEGNQAVNLVELFGANWVPTTTVIMSRNTGDLTLSFRIYPHVDLLQALASETECTSRR